MSKGAPEIAFLVPQPVTLFLEIVIDSKDPEGSAEAKVKGVCFEYGLLPLTLLPDLSNGFELKARIVGSLIGNGA